MSYTDKKITQEEINAHHVQGATDYLIGNAQQNKAVFDNLPEFIAGKFNDLIDEIAGQHGDEIKVAVDEWLAEHPEATTTVQDNSLTTAKYVDGSVTPAKLDRTYATPDDLNVLDARMDEFVSLPEGSTSGDAELLDIRVGANGITYPTAGGAVRGQVGDLKSDLANTSYVDETITPIRGMYITGATTIGQSFTPTYTANTGWMYAIVFVHAGDVLNITGKGGDGSRLYRLVDANGSLVAVSNANVDYSESPVSVKVEKDGKAYLNFNRSSTYALTISRANAPIIETVVNESAMYDISFTYGGHYSGGTAIGSAFEGALTKTTGWAFTRIPVSVGDVVKVTGKGGSGARLYVVTDENDIVFDIAAASVQLTDHVLYIYQSGYVYVNVNTGFEYKLSKIAPLEEIYSYATGARHEYVPEINLWGYNSGSAIIGATYTPAFTWNTAWVSTSFEVYSGDVVKVTGKGGSGSRLYTVVDKSGLIVSVASPSALENNKEVVIGKDGMFYANFDKSYAYSIYVVRGIGISFDEAKEKTDDMYDEYVPSKFLYNRNIPDASEPITAVKHNPTAYMPYEEIIAGYDALVSSYSSYVTKTTLGTDQSGTYNIYRYDFKPSVPDIMGNLETESNYTKDSYPTIIIDACIHGSERPCALALLNFMSKVAESYDENNIFGWLRSNVHFIINPIANPYGYVNGIRGNVNGVDLNRNFYPFWSYGSSDTSSSQYHGTSALSEKETQYIYNILTENKDNTILYYSFHTFGEVAQGYNHMSCYFFGPYKELKMQEIGISTLIDITKSGWKNHNLPPESGIIGQVHDPLYGRSANACWQGAALGIPSACPEVIYKYYDGTSGTVFNADLNCINAEWIAKSVGYAIKTFLD